MADRKAQVKQAFTPKRHAPEKGPAGKGKPARKAGRPRIKLNAQQVEKLAGLGLTTPELADYFDCSPDTLQRRYADAMKRGRDKLRLSFRRQLVKAAAEGKTAAIIFGNKVFNGMRETVQVGNPVGEGFTVDISGISADERRKRLEELAAKMGTTVEDLLARQLGQA